MSPLCQLGLGLEATPEENLCLFSQADTAKLRY